MSGSDNYECTLDKASLEKAEKELNEIPEEREGAVESLRQWVNANSSWLKSPTDTTFLLNILRTSKFVQLSARKRLVKFWETRTKNNDWFENIDTHDAQIAECLRMGTLLVMPKRDKEGRVIFLYRPGVIDPSKIRLADLRKSVVALLDLTMADENVQVNGSVTLHDFSGLTMKHQKFYGMDNMKRSTLMWLHGFAARYKEIHYYNTNPIFEAIFTIISPMFPAKMRKRLHFPGKNLAAVYKYIDQRDLPLDYLPDEYSDENRGSVQELLDDQIKRLQDPAARRYILRMSSSGYGVDEARKPSDAELFAESFRKLHVE